jgi:hypothetical protein
MVFELADRPGLNKLCSARQEQRRGKQPSGVEWQVQGLMVRGVKPKAEDEF